MTKDEALRLALEALIDADYLLDAEGYGHAFQQEAITAIKAALEAKVEPVAWFWFDERDGGEWIHIADNQINADKFGNAKVIPLYTTPPQRKPLTDEEITDLYFDGFSISKLTEFARAIEAAHGIKGEA